MQEPLQGVRMSDEFFAVYNYPAVRKLVQSILPIGFYVQNVRLKLFERRDVAGVYVVRVYVKDVRNQGYFPTCFMPSACPAVLC